MSETVEKTHLRRLVRLRYVVIAGQATAILVVHIGLGVALPFWPMAMLVAALAGLNVLTRLRLDSARIVTPTELTLQLLADIAQLTALLFLSGGYSNPFMFMLLPPLAIAAAALATWQALSVAAFAVLCYSLLLTAYVPLPALERPAMFTPAVLRQTGMWVCFVVSAAVIFFFVLRTRHTLRAKDRELAEARERALRNEHLAELGGLAAGTAHELGTPLATLSMLAEELEEYATDPEQREQLRLLRQQVYRCRAAIDQLGQSASAQHLADARHLSVGEWLDGLVRRWRDSFPEATIHLSLPEHDGPELVLGRTLDQALSSLVANACRVSASVAISTIWSPEALTIEILDDGPGLPAGLRSLAGREPVGGHPGVHGAGLGLYLANSTVERLGGRLTLVDREGKGTRARITLPLNKLRAEEYSRELTAPFPAAG